MSYERMPIVGAYHRPPAQVLIDCLAIGTPLFLMAEPTNAFDIHAIQVFLESKNIPEEAYPALEEKAGPYGFDLDTILGQEQWHLGYIPKAFAAELKLSGTIVDGVPVDVLFTLSGDKPRVEFAQPVL